MQTIHLPVCAYILPYEFLSIGKKVTFIKLCTAETKCNAYRKGNKYHSPKQLEVIQIQRAAMKSEISQLASASENYLGK